MTTIKTNPPLGKSYLPPRPNQRTPSVIKEVAGVLAEKILKEWNNNEDDGMTKDEVELDIQKLLEKSYSTDGYELAKDLESKGWMPDAGLVRILDDVLMIFNRVISKAEMDWLAETELQPPEIGVKVKHKQLKGYVGEVVENHTLLGKSTVSCEEVARRTSAGVGFIECDGVRIKTNSMNIRSIGCVLPWEELEMVEENDYEFFGGFQNCCHCGKQSTISGISEKYDWICQNCQGTRKNFI